MKATSRCQAQYRYWTLSSFSNIIKWYLVGFLSDLRYIAQMDFYVMNSLQSFSVLLIQSIVIVSYDFLQIYNWIYGTLQTLWAICIK